jgi:hypothetical protein
MRGSKPMAASVSKWRFQAFMFALSLVTTYLGCQSIRVAVGGGARFHAAAVRLVAVGLRDPALPPSAVDVAAVGALRDGCRCCRVSHQ